MSTPAPLLALEHLRIAVDTIEVVKGVTLSIRPGEIHAIMGPNGSGKSTLVNTLMGHPAYTVTGGSVSLDGEDLLTMETSDRAKKGLFLAFQYPKEIAGVTLRSFLFAAYKAQMLARHPDRAVSSPIKFRTLLQEKMKELKMDPAFAERFLNKGFSGGEKKKAEVLQMAILEPRLALLDETDSGLDIDALQIVAEGISRIKQESAEQSSGGAGFSALIVTHYARILDFVQPDHVHVMVDGVLRESGTMDLARRLEKEGYAKYGVKEQKGTIGLDIDG